MPKAFSRRTRNVYFAITLILTAFILGLVFYNPELDRDSENFHIEDLNIKHQRTTPTPIVRTVEVLQPTHEPIRVKQPHSIEHVGYSNKTTPAADRTSLRPCTVKKNETVNDITRAQNVATLELLTENGLTFPLQGPFADGTVLCLPKTCLLEHIKDDQKCHDIVDRGFTQPRILAWNPSAAKGLESGSLCHALDVIVGVYICISELGEEFSYKEGMERRLE